MRHFGAVKIFFCFMAACIISLQTAAAAWDPEKYISIDEIKTDMDAYCLTVFYGSNVEKFDLKILSVVRGLEPNMDMILVEGVDPRFQHSSTVHGCSGSSVFIDGRLAGALAAGWDGGLDSLYLVRPIADMLEVGAAGAGAVNASAGSMGYDYSQPLNLDAYYEQSMERLKQTSRSHQNTLPLSCTLPQSVCREYTPMLEALSLTPVAAGGLLPSAAVEQTGPFERGGVLSLVLCGGDISLAATGTVTEVVGDQLYGFGHSFQGQGAVNFPIASGVVHTVVASRKSSFKLSSPGPILGTLEFDQSTAVRGTIGKMPKTIPLHIEVKRFDDPLPRKYDCYVAVDRELTPAILQVVISGTALMKGPLPTEHSIRYTSHIKLDDGTVVTSENLTSGSSVMPIARELYSASGVILNNPFGEAAIESIDCTMDIQPTDMTASIWQVDVSDVTVKPGEIVSINALVKSYRAEDETVSMDFTVPGDLEAGTYKIQLMGTSLYRSFIAKAAPQKFRYHDLPTLEEALVKSLQYPQDRLYAVMESPSTGLVIHQYELGNLPPTKMLLMQDSRRLRPLQPYQSWAESSIETDKIISGSAEIEINVEH